MSALRQFKRKVQRKISKGYQVPSTQTGIAAAKQAPRVNATASSAAVGLARSVGGPTATSGPGIRVAG